MPSLAATAKHIALLRLEENPGGLRRAEWLADAVEMLLDAEHVGVDAEVTLAAAWASATIGFSYWLGTGDGYQVEDVCRDLGDPVARVVSWTSPADWQDRDQHIGDLVAEGPVEARIIVLGQVMVGAVLSVGGFTSKQTERLIRLAMSVPALLPRAVAAGWPVAPGEA